MTPIALAAAEGQWEVVKDSTARNANLETKDDTGILPPLGQHSKAGWRSWKTCAAHNANLEAKDDRFGMTPIALAARKASGRS